LFEEEEEYIFFLQGYLKLNKKDCYKKFMLRRDYFDLSVHQRNLKMRCIFLKIMKHHIWDNTK